MKKDFPNLKIVTLPGYSTDAGELVQLIVDSYQDQATAELSFTEKMHVHPMIQKLSGFEKNAHRVHSAQSSIVHC